MTGARLRLEVNEPVIQILLSRPGLILVQVAEKLGNRLHKLDLMANEVVGGREIEAPSGHPLRSVHVAVESCTRGVFYASGVLDEDLDYAFIRHG